mgnify:CR=1 FL=1
MEVKATAKTLRIQPRKARLVLDLIRGKDVEEAAAILKFLPNKGGYLVGKVLHSAVANAVNNNDLDESKLYVKACWADEGITLKRPENTIDDVIPEVTLNIHEKTEKTATISVKPDTEAAKDALIEFVGKYNQALSELNILSQNKPSFSGFNVL